jgi:hypothetical protein
MTINSLINLCRGHDIQQNQRFPKEDVKFYASHYYYRRLALIAGISCTTIGILSAFAQRSFKPFCFLSSSVMITGSIFRYFKSCTSEIISIEECEKRLTLNEEDSLQKNKQLHVIQLIKTFFPQDKLPKVSFSFNKTCWLPESYTINISREDLESSTIEDLEQITAHEIGHCCNADNTWLTVFYIFTDIVRFSASYTNNIPVMILVNTGIQFSRMFYRSFREKEADRFAIKRLNSGAKKTILIFNKMVELGHNYLWTQRGYDTQESILLDAAKNPGKGIVGSHPTEYQRITWAMQHLKKPAVTTNCFKEFYRFLSTPFYGDLQLLEEAMDIE